MDVVKEMEEAHMKEIGMAAGHILKLRKRLAEMKPLKRRESYKEQKASAEVSCKLLEGDFNEEDAASPEIFMAMALAGLGGQLPGSFTGVAAR